MTATAPRLAELAAAYGLGEPVAAALERLLGLLAGDPTAPTTVTAPSEALDAHVADALVGLELEAVRTAGRIADLGAGAGLPGLVLAAARPEAAVTLVESAARKTAFLDRAVRVMGLANVEVVTARAEDWPAGALAHDLVTARALAALPVLVEYAAPLLAPGGALAAWKGRRDAAEEADGRAAAAATGLREAEIRSVSPFPSAQHRHLYLYLKVGPTPEGFPRRPGMARKRPIRASG